MYLPRLYFFFFFFFFICPASPFFLLQLGHTPRTSALRAQLHNAITVYARTGTIPDYLARERERKKEERVRDRLGGEAGKGESRRGGVGEGLDVLKNLDRRNRLKTNWEKSDLFRFTWQEGIT